MSTRGEHSSQSVLNALILLGCDEGDFQDRQLTTEQIGSVLPVQRQKDRAGQEPFRGAGPGGRSEQAPAQREYRRKADGDFEAHLVALSCSQPPEGHARWSLHLLADKMVELEYVDSVSYETVRRVLKKTS